MAMIILRSGARSGWIQMRIPYDCQCVVCVIVDSVDDFVFLLL